MSGLLTVEACAVAAPIEGVHDYGLKEYVYTSRDLPHSEAKTWKLVCQLPYNARFAMWIRV